MLLVGRMGVKFVPFVSEMRNESLLLQRLQVSVSNSLEKRGKSDRGAGQCADSSGNLEGLQEMRVLKTGEI